MRVKYLIKEIREKRGLTLRELSKKTGISNGYLSEIENNLKNPSLLHVILIAKALEVDITELYEVEW